MTHIIHTEIVQRFGNFNLFGSVEEGIGKLFPFSQGALNDLEARYIAQKITDGLVRI